MWNPWPPVLLAVLGWGFLKVLRRGGKGGPNAGEALAQERARQAEQQAPAAELAAIASKWQAKAAGPAAFDVFLSHTGAQKYNFVDHIHNAFARRYQNVRVFLDEKSLEPGRVPDEEIDAAMLCSPVAIIVLSPEFVRKEYPMYELEFLLAGHRQRKVTLVPVLYNLPYSHTQNLMAAYASEPWVGGEHTPSDEVLRRWAANVKELLDITAVRRDQYRGEAGLVEGVVDVVVPHLRAAGCAVVRHPAVRVKEGTVGLEPRREELVGLLRQHGMVLLHGMGGIGKTTLADATYKLLLDTEFAKHLVARMSFSAGTTCEEIRRQQGVVLQQLGEQAQLVDVRDGQQRLAAALQGKRVLLLVDNVWGDQLMDALPADIMQVLAGTQSMVLVCSRDSTVAQQFEPQPYLLSMPLLSDAEARQLFCVGAFGAADAAAPEDKAEQVDELLQKCNGLPFAIEVTSKFLKGKKIGDWLHWEQAVEEAFKRQSAVRPGESMTLYAAVRVSYDALARNEQELLHDVAFLVKHCRDPTPFAFVGFEWRTLEAFDRDALEVLLARGLIIQKPRFDELESFVADLHDSVMSFCFSQLLEGHLTGGRAETTAAAVDGALALQDTSCTHLAAGQQHRILGINQYEESEWVATATPRDTQQPPAPACLRVLWLGRVQWAHTAAISRLSQLQLLYFAASPYSCDRGLPDQLLSSCTRLRVLHLDDIDNVTLHLQGLEQLKELVIRFALKLQNVEGWEHLSKLDFLAISACKSLRLQPVQGFSNLRSFKLYSRLGCTPDLRALHSMQKLEHLQLQYVDHLVSLPGLSNLTALEHLTISHCSSLMDADSLPHLAYLSHLDINHCNRLTCLGNFPAPLQQLRSLSIESCRQLTVIPFRQLTSLTHVQIRFCDVLLACPDMHGAINVQQLSITGCRALTSLSGLHELAALTQLAIKNCRQLQAIPDLSRLCNLQQLVINECDMLQLPTPLSLPALTELRVDSRRPLASIPAFWTIVAPSLHKLHVASCSSLQHIASLAGCPRLQDLSISDCGSLAQVVGLPLLAHLSHLQVASCVQLTSLGSETDSFQQLHTLRIACCPRLTAIPSLRQLTCLAEVTIMSCDALLACPVMHGATTLQNLTVVSCASLTSLPSLHHAASLKALDIHGCSSLLRIAGLSGCSAVTSIHVECCDGLQSISGLDGCLLLKHLTISGCGSLVDLPGIGRLPALQHLSLSNCAVQQLPGLGRLAALESLILRSCPLTHLDSLSGLTSLTSLVVRHMNDLPHLRGLGALTQLYALRLGPCHVLQEPPDLSTLAALQWLTLVDVPCVQSLRCVSRMKALQHLSIHRCGGLHDIGDISVLEQLRHLQLVKCTALTRIEGLEARWTNLGQWNREVKGCPALEPAQLSLVAPTGRRRSANACHALEHDVSTCSDDSDANE